MRGNGCYGSDLRNRGFSGYLCELLVINYNTFENVLKQARNWRYQDIVDMEKAYTTRDYKRLKRNFKDQPFIFIDPTDKNRNVAAVLSREKYATFILDARKFLEKPSFNYFFPKERKINKKKILGYLKKKKSKIIVIEFKKPEIIDDILYPQLRRFRRMIVKILKENDFRVTDSWIYSNRKCGIALELIYTELPTYKKISGPSVFNPPEHQDMFIKKYKKVWFEGDRFFAEVKRKYYKSEDFLRDHLKCSEKKLIEKGIPNHLAKVISKKFRIIKENEIKKIKEEEFWKGLGKLNTNGH
jgi:tRNA nucleotidyltransferase (CCA-adding enzyme)